MFTVIGNPEGPTEIQQNNMYKMAMLRAAVTNSYPLESIEKNNRITAIADLIKDIKDIIDTTDTTPYFVLNPNNNLSLIYQIFKGQGATSLAASNPSEVINTCTEVKDYYAVFIMDLVYKSVYGTYPPDNAEAIHGILDDVQITPLTKHELQAVYTKLRQHTVLPLLSSEDIENLRKICPHPGMQPIPENSFAPEVTEITEVRTKFCKQVLQSHAFMPIAFILGSANLLLLYSHSDFKKLENPSFRDIDDITSKILGSLATGTLVGFVVSAAGYAAVSACIKKKEGDSNMASSINHRRYPEVRFSDFIAKNNASGSSSSGYVGDVNSRRPAIMSL